MFWAIGRRNDQLPITNYQLPITNLGIWLTTNNQLPITKKVGHWVKLNYERKEYIIDLDRIGAFALASNGRVTLWLPHSSIPLIFSHEAEPAEYDKILSHIDKITAHSNAENWMRIECDRKEYIINLNRISSFCHAGKKLIFWLPDSGIDITLTPEANPEAYQKLQDFIHRITGESFSD